MRIASLCLWSWVVVVAIAAGACVDDAGEGEGEAASFDDVKSKIFSPRCSATGCHGSDNPAQGLDLVTDAYAALVDVPSVEDPAIKRVVAGDADASLLYQVLQGPVGGTAQMPDGAALPADDVELVRSWIEAGAKP